MPRYIQEVKFFTVAEIAKMLDITPALVGTYIKQGRLKSIRVGRMKLVSVQELTDYRSRLLTFKKHL